MNVSASDIGVGFAPRVWNSRTRQRPRGVRSLIPCRSAGASIGLRLFVMWRNPFSQTASSSKPRAAASGASRGQTTSRSILLMWSRSRTRYGISKRPKDSTADDMIVEGSERSTVPSFSLMRRVSSSPSWLEPKTVTRAVPSRRAFARLANSSAETAVREPGDATCAKRSSNGPVVPPQPTATRARTETAGRCLATTASCARCARAPSPWSPRSHQRRFAHPRRTCP